MSVEGPEILVVEDEEKLAKALASGRGLERYVVEVALTGEDGFFAAAENAPAPGPGHVRARLGPGLRRGGGEVRRGLLRQHPLGRSRAASGARSEGGSRHQGMNRVIRRDAIDSPARCASLAEVRASRPRVDRWCGLLLVGLAGACGDQGSGGGPAVVYSSVDQVFAEPVLRAFEAESGATVRKLFDTEETKSTGVLNRLIAEARNPQADVFWSGDPVRPFLLMKRGLVEPYASPAAADIPAAFKAADGTWTGLGARARVLLLNTAQVGEENRPASIRDLASPRWMGRTAIANPLFGTTTVHVAALATVWGEEALKSYLQDLRKNDVRVASSNGEVKRLVQSGEVAFGLTDIDDAYAALRDGAPVAIVHPDREGMGTLVLPTVVVLLKGAPHPESARRLVDHLLSAASERRLVASGGFVPLRPGLAVPEGLTPASALRTLAVDFAAVAETMETLQPWLREWAGL